MSGSDGTSPSPRGTESRQSSPQHRRAAARDAQHDEDDEEIDEKGDCIGGEWSEGMRAPNATPG